MTTALVTSEERNKIVTRGYLDDRLQPIYEKLEQVEGLQKGVASILEEMKNMREENKEMYRMREQLYSNDVIQESRMDSLEERVHVLEIAK